MSVSGNSFWERTNGKDGEVVRELKEVSRKNDRISIDKGPQSSRYKKNVTRKRTLSRVKRLNSR